MCRFLDSSTWLSCACSQLMMVQLGASDLSWIHLFVKQSAGWAISNWATCLSSSNNPDQACPQDRAKGFQESEQKPTKPLEKLIRTPWPSFPPYTMDQASHKTILESKHSKIDSASWWEVMQIYIVKGINNNKVRELRTFYIKPTSQTLRIEY